MIRQLLTFEIHYQRKQWALYIGMVLFFLCGLQVGAQNFAPDLIHFNAPYQITYYTSIFTLGTVFAIMFFSISGVLRENAYHCESIIYSSGLKKKHYFISRYLGVLIFSIIAFSPFILGMIVGTYSVSHEPSRLAPFSLTPYLLNWLVFIVPNIFISSSIIFSVSLLTKNRLSVYASAVLIYILYFVCSFYFDSPILANSTPTTSEFPILASLSDPFGISAFMEQSQFWTASQKNIENVSLTGNMLLNRVLWLSFALLILGITYNHFSFRSSTKKIKRSEQASHQVPTSVASLCRILQTPFTFRAYWMSFIYQTKMGLIQMFKNLPFWVIFLVWGFVTFFEIFNTIHAGGRYSESLYPITYILISLIQEPLFILGTLLIIFYSGEWFWKEKNENLYHIIDATPVSSLSIFASKVAVLMTIPILFIALGIIISLGFQVAGNFYQFEPLLHFSSFYYQGLPLFFLIVMAIFMQALLPNKYLAMLATGIFILTFNSPLSGSLGIQHPLLRFGRFPEVIYTDMNGYGDFFSIFALLSSHWILLGGILSMLSFKLLQRGVSDGFLSNLKRIFQNWSTPQAFILSSLLILFCSTSGIIFYKTNLQDSYTNFQTQLDERESYERAYKQYENLERLYPATIKTDVALFPEEHRFTVNATYLLVNKSETPIDTVLITEKEVLTDVHLQRAILLEQNQNLGTYLFKFETPISPHDTVSFSYSLEKRQRGLNPQSDIIENGSYVTLRSFSPALSYLKGYEITNEKERTKRGLPAREKDLVSEADLTLFEAGYGKIYFETTLSTSSDQTGISVGDLVKEWTENNRNYYHYKASVPVSPSVGYFSASYHLDRIEYDGLEFEFYTHPSHNYNNELIKNSTIAAMEYCQREFGSYPFQHLRIAEIPSYWSFGGFAHPGTISMVEDNLYLVDERDSTSFSLIAKRTIHEVAHQWWGHKLMPRNTPGGSIFVEGFAKYTEAVIMEQLYGKKAVFQLSKTANRIYFLGRSNSNTMELPLYLEQGQGYLLYGKAYTIMLALKELIGEKTMNQVMKKLVDENFGNINPTLTSLDFIDALYEVTPIEQHILIDDWLKRIITYDLRIKSADFTTRSDGKFEVTLRIQANKEEHIDGFPVNRELQESIPIGLFSNHPSEASNKEIIYLDSHHLQSGENTITITVNKIPKFVSIDPYGTRLDMVRTDNFLEM